MGQALGLVTRDEAGQPPAGVMPPARSVLPATMHEALTLDAIYRAFFIFETATMQLTLDVWRGQQRIETPPIVRNPDLLDGGQSAFLAQTVTSLAGRGNAYWRRRRSGTSGEVLALEVLDPREVTAQIHPDTGRPVYTWRGHDLPARDVSHLKLLRVPGEAEGLGPIQAARRRITGAIQQVTYADGWFDTAGVPNGVLSTDQPLNAEQAKAWKQQWMDSQRYGDGPAVLGAGLDYRPLMLKPAEVQWLESQQFTVTSFARLLGIPASLMLAAIEGQNLTYQNQEQADQHFIRFTLMRYFREIEQAFTQLLPRGQVARFNVDALLRTDTKTRYEAHQIALDAGFLTKNEVRAIEGLDPLPTAATPAPEFEQEPANA